MILAPSNNENVAGPRLRNTPDSPKMASEPDSTSRLPTRSANIPMGKVRSTLGNRNAPVTKPTSDSLSPK